MLADLRRFQAHGFAVTTRYPAVGLAAQVKAILLQSTRPVAGERLQTLSGSQLLPARLMLDSICRQCMTQRLS